MHNQKIWNFLHMKLLSSQFAFLCVLMVTLLFILACSMNSVILGSAHFL